MALNPEVRLERFLAGQNLTPAVRLEYFLAGAASYGLAALQDEAAAIAAGGTAVATIQDAADNVPLQSLVISIDPVQEGTGDPSPENIRPISGHTQATLWVKPTYDPDSNPTVSLSLGQTVYGGKIDLVTGEGEITHALWTKNTSTMNNAENYPGWTSSGIKALIGSGLNKSYYNQMLNVGTSFSVNTSGDYDILFLLKDGDQSYGLTQTQWKALAIDLQIYVKLSTPIPLSLTGQQIQTYKGDNNFWADTGNVLSIEYKQDPEASANEIKALIAPVLPEMKADANLTANDFRIVGNTLYKITASIAAGGTLTPGSNCTATTVGAQLKALL